MRKIWGFLIILTIIAAPFVAFWQYQNLWDWWKLHNYTPPPAVVALADNDTMTSSGRHLFYINHPLLTTDGNTFNAACPSPEQTIVLGCYHPIEDGIYVYNVQDSRLQGVQQVTAAHEMLHAAYDRLSSKDKAYVNGLLMDYYNDGLTDQRVKDNINAYKKTEPNDVVNEMHSIFGTEVGNLPAPLEAYYKRFFTNRAAIVAYTNNYEGEFTSRTNEINADDAKLATMKQNIDAEEKSLDRQSAQIDADRSALESRRNSESISRYNAEVDNFNAEVDAYNRAVAKLKSDIAAYNRLVDERNAIASELRSLDQALETKIGTQPTN